MKSDAKKIERRARFLLLNKEIPQAKMDVVRSLLSNDKLLPEERFGTVIDLIKNCPDKQAREDVGKKIEIAQERKKPAVSKAVFPVSIGLAQHSAFVDEINFKYSGLRLFKKRYLIHSSTFFRISIKKRLVPSRRLFRLFDDVSKFQEKIIARLPSAMEIMLSDERMQEPKIYNYVRAFYSWMLVAPLSRLSFDTAKWLDCPTFESEFRQYLSFCCSFERLDVSTRERIILSIEDCVRRMPDLVKETVLPLDGDSAKAEKEKTNLRKEKEIFEYILALRSFLPTSPENRGSVDRMLSDRYSIASLSDLLNAVFEALVFRRPVSHNELLSYYNVREPQVKADEWDCSPELLKKYGKDEQSRRQKKIDQLQEELSPLDRIVELIGMKFEGADILQSVFEDQWKLIDRRRQDPAAIKLEDFITYIGSVLQFFEKGMLPFLDGGSLPFVCSGERFEGRIFTKNSFEMRASLLQELLRDISTYRTNVPNERVAREEIRKIMSGNMKTMDHIQSFVFRTSSLFYSIAADMHRLLLAHERWEDEGRFDGDTRHREPVNVSNIGSDESGGRPVPYYDCVFSAPEGASHALKLFSSRPVFGESSRDCIYKYIMAFSFQLAYETFSEELLKELDRRRDLRNQIKLLGGAL